MAAAAGVAAVHTNKESFCRLSSLSLPIHLPLRISHHFCFLSCCAGGFAKLGLGV